MTRVSLRLTRERDLRGWVYRGDAYDYVGDVDGRLLRRIARSRRKVDGFNNAMLFYTSRLLRRTGPQREIIIRAEQKVGIRMKFYRADYDGPAQ